jgi:hypothetical protein
LGSPSLFSAAWMATLDEKGETRGI